MIDCKKVRVIKYPNDKDVFYSSSVGKEFYVKHYNDIYYYVVTAIPKGGWLIRKEDCEVIIDRLLQS